jgi:SSS family solute:Na+ symporter
MFAFFISFALYLSILIGVGIYGYQKNKGNLNGDTHPRTINYWVTALSAHAADMSIWLFFGLPGAIYFNGTSECWVVVGLIGGMWATWHFVAPKLRVASETTKSTTLTNFLCTTAGDTKGYLTLVSSCLLLFFFLFYIAVGFSGIGTILMFTFGIPHWLGIIASAIFVTGYVSLGGYATVAFIDAFQGFFLSCMIVLIPLLPHGNSRQLERCLWRASLLHRPCNRSHSLPVLLLHVIGALGTLACPAFLLNL